MSLAWFAQLSLLPTSEYVFQVRGFLFEGRCALHQPVGLGSQLCDLLNEFLIRGLRHVWPSILPQTGPQPQWNLESHAYAPPRGIPSPP